MCGLKLSKSVVIANIQIGQLSGNNSVHATYFHVSPYSYVTYFHPEED